MNRQIENAVWKVDMIDSDWQYVVVTRKKDGKEIMCYSSGNVSCEIELRKKEKI